MWAFAAGLSSVLIRLIALLGAENFKFLNVLTLDFRSSVDGVPSRSGEIGIRAPKMTYLFAGYALDPERRELRYSNKLVAVEPQVFDILEYLVRNRDRVVSKDEIFDAIWHGRAVSESALTSRINAARFAIGNSGEDQRLIRTLRGKGLRFVGTVQELSAREGSSATPGIGQPGPLLAVPDRPSIAVLPFTNMSGEPEQEYFADGITEDIITALSRVRQFFLDRTQLNLQYKGLVARCSPCRDHARCALRGQGSVRKVGGPRENLGAAYRRRHRKHIWAERFDPALDDIFAIQDEITRSIVGRMSRASPTPSTSGPRQPAENLGAWELLHRGMMLIALRMKTTTQRRGCRRSHRLTRSGFLAADAAIAWSQQERPFLSLRGARSEGSAGASPRSGDTR